MTDVDRLREEIAVLRAKVEALERGGAAPAPLDDEALPAGAVDVVVCTVDGAGRVAFPLAYVVEIVMAAATAPVPEAPPWVVGLLDLRGHAVPVVDLAARLGTRPTGVELSDQFVIASPDGRSRVGLLVASVEGVHHLDRDPGGMRHVAHAAYVRAVLASAEGPVLLLGIRRALALATAAVAS